MDISIDFLEGQKLAARFGEHTVISDQSPKAGGEGSMPEPFDYFLASLPLCAAFYVRAFCAKREIPVEGIKITQADTKDETDKAKRTFDLTIELPPEFPEKYCKAVLIAAKSCTIKKVIEAGPEFRVTLKQ